MNRGKIRDKCFASSHKANRSAAHISQLHGSSATCLRFVMFSEFIVLGNGQTYAKKQCFIASLLFICVNTHLTVAIMSQNCIIVLLLRTLVL